MLLPRLRRKQGRMVLDSLKKWKILPQQIDLIASHGQTIFHAPAWMHQQAEFGNSTLQIGDTDQMAVTTGIISLGDFRQKHIAAGGEGAPLARSEEHTSELQSLMRISYAVFCVKKKRKQPTH